MADNQDWSSNANEAVKLTLVRPGSSDLTGDHSFNPKFTYPIFGDEEAIFGYQGLTIEIRFASHDLSPNVDVFFDRKFKPVGETEAFDIIGELQKWIPSDAFDKAGSYADDVRNCVPSSVAPWTPPGNLIKSYQIGDQQYEIWKGSFSDPKVLALVERMQFFVPLFIEAGTCISLADPKWTIDRWRVFLVYHKHTQPASPGAPLYAFAGFCTTYRNFVMDPASPNSTIDVAAELPLAPESAPSPDSLPCRERISQFLVLPPYQGSGHGSTLYRTVYASLLADPTVIEVTVEDPSEAFDDLRDYCDLQHLRSLPDYVAVKIDTNVTFGKKGKLPTAKLLPTIKLQKIRVSQKIAPRQFDRVTEMHLLDSIPETSRGSSYSSSAINALRQKHNPQSGDADKQYKYWQLLVKQRIYKRNKDVLMQLDRQERIEKLNEARAAQEDAYVKLLLHLKEGSSRGKAREEGEDEQATEEKAKQMAAVRAERSRKRSIFDDDEDDGMASEDSRASKRPKV
ncbi:MAG: histone acetyltransferase 1 [Vezdaea aestivalis]|nr:MAG: histone acetyltransferase 1 [Vezdaea aestivalis]